MPRAGWCRECDRWVWVDDQGGCQFGHPADSVDRVHEQEEPEVAEGLQTEVAPAERPIATGSVPAEKPFGVGPMPPELARFSWGAFLMPLFWGVVYGSWPVLGAWAAVLAVPLLLSAMFPAGETSSAANTIIGVTVASELAAGIARLWIGANANKTVWRREALRLSVIPGAKPRFSVQRFRSRQIWWTIAGAAFVAIGFVFLVPMTAETWSKYGLTYIGAAMPLVWMAAEVLLGVWLDSRMKTEPPDNEQAAQDFV